MPKVKTKRENILTRGEVESMLDKTQNLRDKSMIAFLYLFGARISEVRLLKKEDFWIENDKLCVRIRVKKRREKVLPFKHIVKVALTSPFVGYIIEYLETKELDDRLWNIDRTWAWRIIKKLNPDAWLHLFRHTRLTKLAEKGATDQQLATWAGWKDPRPAGDYVQRSSRLIEELAYRID